MNQDTKYKLTGAGIIVGSILIIALLIGFIFGGPLRKTPADKIALSYGGGMFEGAEYQGTIQPASSIRFNGWFDRWYEYPVTQRDVTVAADAEVEEGDKDYGVPDAIFSKTSDGVDCIVELAVTFKLNTNQIREFHETIGLKFQAWTEAGWGRMLLKNFLPPLENSVQEQCRKTTSDDIAKNAEMIPEFAQGVSAGLKTTINSLLGGDDIFCGPEFKVGEEACPDFEVVVKSVRLPDGINQSIQDQVAAANRLVTAQSDTKVKEEQARAEQAARNASAEAIADPNYLRNKYIDAITLCAGNQNCTLVVTPDDTGVNINTGP